VYPVLYRIGGFEITSFGVLSPSVRQLASGYSG
jgi:hypothetical protein